MNRDNMQKALNMIATEILGCEDDEDLAEIATELNYMKDKAYETITQLNRKVTVKKVEGKTRDKFVYNYKGYTFEATYVAYAGRLRLWEMTQGVRGLKRGKVLVNEALGGPYALRSVVRHHVEANYVKK